MKMKLMFLVMMSLVAFPYFGHAQETETTQAAPAAPAADPAGLERRVALAKEIHQHFKPVQDQISGAIDNASQQEPPETREAFRTAMRAALNFQAIEKISIDAMAESYSEGELAAMLEYYKKPEAKTAAEKDKDYVGKVYPEIIKMLDAALIRVRTGNAGP